MSVFRRCQIWVAHVRNFASSPELVLAQGNEVMVSAFSPLQLIGLIQPMSWTRLSPKVLWFIPLVLMTSLSLATMARRRLACLCLSPLHVLPSSCKPPSAYALLSAKHPQHQRECRRTRTCLTPSISLRRTLGTPLQPWYPITVPYLSHSFRKKLLATTGQT